MKILIWDKDIPLTNTGGPSGYLWNIHEFLREEPEEQIVFYSDIINKESRSSNIVFRFFLWVLYRLRLNCIFDIVFNYASKGALSETEIDVIKTFDYVHFHSISSAIGYNSLIKKCGPKTILTTHTPEPLINELCGGKSVFRDFILSTGSIRNYFIRKEVKALDSVNYLMYPVRHAIECYTNTSCIYRDFFDKMDVQRKTFYVPTCIPDKSIDRNISILASLNIPEGAKKICYVGRHTDVKGYPYLKEIASKLFDQNNDIYFVLGGAFNESEIVRHKNWIELGWVNTDQLLNEIDVFVLPNKQTYFDLIALEILRSGTPLITTLTGGNKDLHDVNKGGIVFIPENDADSAAKILKDIFSKDINELGKKNRELFLETFIISHYVHNYIDAIKKLI